MNDMLYMSWVAGKELFCKDEVRFRIVGGQDAWNYDLHLDALGSSADCPRIQFCLALATHANTHQFLLEFVTTIQPKCKPKDAEICISINMSSLVLASTSNKMSRNLQNHSRNSKELKQGAL